MDRFAVCGMWLAVSALVVAGIFGMSITARRMRRLRNVRHGKTALPEERVVTFAIDGLAAELEGKALAYAIYQAILKDTLSPEQEQELFDRFSYVNMPPKLEDCHIFKKSPELISDPNFLKAVNSWIVQNAGSEQSSFWEASSVFGNLLVNRMLPRAVCIVSEQHKSETL